MLRGYHTANFRIAIPTWCNYNRNTTQRAAEQSNLWETANSVESLRAYFAANMLIVSNAMRT